MRKGKKLLAMLLSLALAASSAAALPAMAADSEAGISLASESSASLTNSSTISATSITKGTSIKLTAKASGGTSPYKYKYYCKPAGDTNWTALTGKVSTSSYSHTPTSTGTYQYAIRVYDSSNKYITKKFTVKVAKALVNSSTVSSTYVTLGNSVKMTAKASGGISPYTYKYFYKLSTDSAWTALTGKVSTSSYSHTPTSTGTYQYAIRVYDSSNKYITKKFTVKVAKALVNSSTVSSTSVMLGNSVKMTAKASGGAGSYTYKYFYKLSTDSAWTALTGKVSTSSYSHTPTSTGTYQYGVRVYDSYNNYTTKKFTVEVTKEESFAEQVVDLVNVERAENGLDPLELDESLMDAAYTRSTELVSSFSHTRPNGDQGYTLVFACGYSYCAGENIAAGYTTPEAVVEGWMNSSGHRANILNENYTSIGVGYYYDSTGTYKHYWTQLFGG